MVSVDVSDDSWVHKSRCSDVYGLSVGVRGGEGVKVIVIGDVRKGVPERGSYQISSIVTKWVVGIDPLGFDGVVVIVFIDVELDVMGFLHAPSWHRNIHFILDVSGVVGVVALVPQGYWEFGVQDFDLGDRDW